MLAVQTIYAFVITLAALHLDGAYGLVETRQSLLRKEGDLDSQQSSNNSLLPGMDPGPDPCCNPGNMTTQDLLDCMSNNIAPGAVEIALFSQCHAFKMCMGCYNLTKQMYIPYCRGIMRGLEGTGLISSERRRRAPQYPVKPPKKSPRRRRGFRFFGHADDSWTGTLKTSLEERTNLTRFNATRVLRVNHCVHPINDPINAWACDRDTGEDSCVKWAIQDCKGLNSWCYHGKFCTSIYVDCKWKAAHCDGWSTSCCDGWTPSSSKDKLGHLTHPDYAGTYGIWKSSQLDSSTLFERANRELKTEGDKSSPTSHASGMEVVTVQKYMVDAALEGKCMGFSHK